MAARQYFDIVEHSVTCPICFEFCADPHIPKDLECPHTCCQVCLQNIVTLNPGQPITCPMKCEQKTRVPTGGVEQLRTNLRIKNLAEEHPSYVKGAKPAVPKCAKHKENMHLYCTFCNTLACHSCGMAYHHGAGHKIVDISDKTEERKGELKVVINEIELKVKSYQESVTKVQKMETGILTGLEAEMKKPAKAREDFIEAIRMEGKRLEDVLQKATDIKLNDIRKERTRLQNLSSRLQAACDVAIKTGETSDHAYITQHEELVKKVKKMDIKDTPPIIDLNLQSAQFAKVETSVTFGHIVNLIQKFGNFEFVNSVASSPTGMLAVNDQSSEQVVIYHENQNGKYEKKLSLELHPSTPNKPHAVMFCPDGELWVARWTGIEVYSSAGKYEKTVSTKQYGEYGSSIGVYSLAITADGTRILAGDIQKNVLTVHDPAGKVIRILKTGIRPFKMAAIQDTHVAILDWKDSKVSVMDMETGYETLCVDIPFLAAVCYDNQSEYCFIARRDCGEEECMGKGILEQYCWRTGRKIACIAQRLYYPTAMTAISDRTLAVADDKSVKIFQIA